MAVFNPLPDREADIQDLFLNLVVFLNVYDEDVIFCRWDDGRNSTDKQVIQWGQEGRTVHVLNSDSYAAVQHLFGDKANKQPTGRSYLVYAICNKSKVVTSLNNRN